MNSEVNSIEESRDFVVYGIGNGIMDLQLKVSEEDFASLELEKGTMNLVDQETQARLLTSLKSCGKPHQASGGSAANSMIALASLGGKAAYGCLLADDEFGKFYESEMKDIGVSVYTTPKEGGVTGSSLILITPDAERTMNTHLGVSAEFGPEHVSSRLTGLSDWIFIEGYLFASPKGQEAAKKAVQYAMKKGTRVAVVFSDTFIVEAFREHLEEAVKYADLIFANRTEVLSFTQLSDEEEAFRAYSALAPGAVMTRGSEGAWCSQGDEVKKVPGLPVKAIDETGAGDMFAGAYLYGISSGLGVEQSGHLACYLASKVVSQLGPRLETSIDELRGSKELDFKF